MHTQSTPGAGERGAEDPMTIEKNTESARAARLRSAKEPVEVREDESTKGGGK